MRSGIRWGSLRTKIIAWSFVPTAIILIAVALVTFTAYQQVTQDLVVGRDRELMRLSAGQLATELTDQASFLTTLARTMAVWNDPAAQSAALQRFSHRLAVFDGGVLILNTFGTVVAAQPERPDALGQDWSNRAYYRQMVRAPGLVFSDIVPDGPQGAQVVIMAVPITGDQGELLGMMAGLFRLGATAVSSFYGSIVKLHIGETGNIYLVDGNGRVIYHSDSSYIGGDFSTQAVVRQVLSGQVGAIRTRDLNGQDIVAGFAPVPGTSWGLVTEESWSALLSASQGYRQFLIVLLALGILLPVLVVTVGVRRITGPIEELIHAAQEVAGGRFGQTISVSTGDELEELAEQFNLMSTELRESYADLERKVADRTKELATLNAIAAVVSRSLNLDEILGDALVKALEVMGFEAGQAFLLEEDTQTLVRVAHYGMSEECARHTVRLPLAASVATPAAGDGQPIVRQVADYPQSELKELLDREGFQLAVSVPLLAKGKMLGAINMATRALRPLAPEERSLLAGIGQQIGVAVENARLYQQAEQLAVIKERQRLARELHDSVTQSLYSLTLLAEAGRRLASAGDLKRVQTYLIRLGETAQQALKEMRLLVYELRPLVLETEGLIGALQQRLDAVEKRAGVDARLLVEGALELPSAVEEGLYRIAQEALNNALKHAAATAVTVRLCANGEGIELEVADNGRGFDPQSASGQGGLGLVGMRERAERLRGSFTVLSAPGEGTRVRISIGTQWNSSEVAQ